MNKKVRKISIIVIILLICILTSIIIYNVFYLPYFNSSKQKDNYPKVRNESYIEEKVKTLNVCKEGLECNYDIQEYTTISTTIKSNNLNNIINSINSKVNYLYEKSKDSTDMTTSQCLNVASLYQRSIMGNSNLIIYESKNLLSFTLLNREIDLCLFTTEEELDVYFYDITNDKLLSNENIKEKYNISDSEVLNAITNNIIEINKRENKNYSNDINEYTIYIEKDGTIGVYYKQKETNSYYNVLLDKHI